MSKTNLEILEEIQLEVTRFQKKIDIAIKNNGNEGQDFASAKRGALDLKCELTKLTQAGRYKWDATFKK